MTEYNNEYCMMNFPGKEGSTLETLSLHLEKLTAKDILFWMETSVPKTVYVESRKCFLIF